MLNSNSHYYKSFKGLLSPNNNRFGSPINNLPTSTVRREANEGVEKNKEYFGYNHYKFVLQQALISSDDFINLHCI